MNPVLDTVLLKVASRCNLDCTYCYVYNMGDDNWKRQEKQMTDETISGICKELSELALHQQQLFSLILHGGEPLLLGPTRLRYLFSSLRSVLSDEYPISIQTNGVLISPQLLDICSEYRVSVAVSIDGPEQLHDNARVTRAGTGSFRAVLAGIEALKAHDDRRFLFAGCLAVIEPTSTPAEIYTFFKEIGAPSVDFLYKDGNHSRPPLGKAHQDSVEYGRWMTGLLSAYLADPAPMPIRILDDMLKVLLGGLVSKEGLGETDFGILIIDTDGTIMKNDTLKSSFPGADQFASRYNIRDTSLVSFLHSTAFQDYRKEQRPSSIVCQNCPELTLCGGGMVLHRWKDGAGFDNPSIYCADQKYLIRQLRHVLSQILPSYA